MRARFNLAGIAVVVNQGVGPPGETAIRACLGAMPHRVGPTPTIHREGRAAWGIGGGAAWARTGRGFVVVDGRLHRREALAGDLGLRGTDAELIAAGWDRWGTDLPQHLAGEFAIVVVEGDRAVLARDAFGSRPLFVWATSDRVVIASEIGALLAAGAPRALDPGAVAAYLRQDWATAPDATFFEAVRRVPPGSLATVPGTWTRWWRAPAVDPALRAPADAARAFRDVLLGTLTEQLSGEDRVVMQLSGGLDSSGVVVAADALCRSGGITAELSAISAVFPGMATDESRYIDAVCRSVATPCERYDASRSGPREDLPFDAAHPWIEVGHAIPAGWKAAALQRGARVVTTGHGGDELLFEEGVFLDLAADRRILALLRETALARRYSSMGWWHHLDTPARHLLPAPVRRAFRAMRPRSDALPPRWSGPRLRGVTPADPPLDIDERPHVRRVTWAGLVSPGRAWIQEILASDAARSGLATRSPYQDRAVADVVLSVPYEARLPRGRMKALLRDGLGDLLPEEVRERRGITGFDGVFVGAAQAQEGLIRSAIEAGDWASEGWVDRSQARGLLERARGSGSIDDWLSIWGLATLELWLRRQ